jgi:hypothetical protein
MGKIYNIVLNSQISAINAALTYGERFYVDWSQLPSVPYKVSFSFMSANQISTNATVANIFIDLGQGSNVKFANTNYPGINTGGNAYRANFLGCLEIRSYTNSTPASASYLYASTTTNPPIYIDGRPQNNSVFVEIHTNGQAQGVDYVPVSGQYTLILSLEAQK